MPPYSLTLFPMQESSRTLRLDTAPGMRKKTVQFNELTEQHEVVRNYSTALILSSGAATAELACSSSSNNLTSNQLTLWIQHTDPKFHKANKMSNCGEEEHANKSDREC